MSIYFIHDCTLVLYAQMIKTGSVLLQVLFSTVLDFTLYNDTGDSPHTIYIALQNCFVIHQCCDLV